MISAALSSLLLFHGISGISLSCRNQDAQTVYSPLQIEVEVSELDARVTVIRSRDLAGQADLPVGFTSDVSRIYDDIRTLALYQGDAGNRVIEFDLQVEDLQLNWGGSFAADFGFSADGESALHSFSMTCSRK